MARNLHAAGGEAIRLQKEKARQWPGLLTNFIFVQLISPAWRSDARAARPFGSHCSCERCCAACISSGSARAIAFSAASRSPLLIASSTDRTAPRIWVRRDLLIMVRRAILRVAFLAELVLAIFSNILRW